jgi:hypothetical protein
MTETYIFRELSYCFQVTSLRGEDNTRISATAVPILSLNLEIHINSHPAHHDLSRMFFGELILDHTNVQNPPAW